MHITSVWGIALIDNSSPPCKTGKTTGEIVFDVPRMAEIVRPNRRFEFQKRIRFVIRPHDETLPIVAMCACNPDCSSVGINR